MPEFREPLVIVCHDTGATNLIIAWVKENPTVKRHVVAKGPAKKLWLTAFPNEVIRSDLKKSFSGVEMLLSGTGWSSDLEHEARCLAAKENIYSVAVVDHWTNYPERFCRDDVISLPDEIWVTDQYAYREAKFFFPEVVINRQKNAYMEEQVSVISNIDVQTTGVLYILEPIRVDWGHDIPGEFQALDFFIQQLEHMQSLDKPSIRLRLHPSESEEKYLGWIKSKQSSKLDINIDQCPQLSESIARASCVVGCHSYALVVALNAGKKVYSSIPPNVSTWVLPHTQITYLRDL